MNNTMQALISASQEALMARMGEVVDTLVQLWREQAMVLSEEIRTEVMSYRDSLAETHAGKERDAKAAAVEYRCTAEELKGAIRALEEERDFIHLLLAHG